jgi:hypothetical protein
MLGNESSFHARNTLMGGDEGRVVRVPDQRGIVLGDGGHHGGPAPGLSGIGSAVRSEPGAARLPGRRGGGELRHDRSVLRG